MSELIWMLNWVHSISKNAWIWNSKMNDSSSVVYYRVSKRTSSENEANGDNGIHVHKSQDFESSG